MKLGAYAIFMFSVALSFYFLGFQPILLVMTEGQDGHNNGVIKLNCPSDDPNCASGENNNAFLFTVATMISVGIFGIALGLITGYSAMYIIPIIMLTVAIQYFILPFGTLFNLIENETIRTPVIFFFNMITVLAVIHFVRGGGT